MHRFIVIIETEVDAEGRAERPAIPARIEVARCFDGADFTVHDCLRAVEDALRAASFHAPEGCFGYVVEEPEPGVPDQRFKV